MKRTTRTALYLTVHTILGLLVALCQQAGAQQLVGKGHWQSLSAPDVIQGTWSVTAQQSATQVNGTMEITGSNVLKTASVTGTIDGKSVLLGLSSDGVTAATFSGQLSGTSVSGEWDCPAVKDQGVWHGTLSVQP
ncbi:MAG: hypothetical protein ACHQ9S_18665 [Candidatus Binatia bacterium]